MLRAEQIVATLSTPLLILGTDLRIRDVNPAFVQTFSIPPEKTIGTTLYEMGDGHFGIPALRSALQQLVEHGEPFERVELDYPLEGQDSRIFQVRGRMLVTDEADSERILLAMQDVTERKMLEEDVLGETLRLFEGPETDPEVMRSFLRAMEHDEPWHGEAVHYRKDGTPYIVQWNMAPVDRADEETEYWISVQRDVTAVRRMWERLLDVQEEERRRIDQEIHDEMGGLLASIQMKAQTARLKAEQNGISLHSLDEMSRLLNELSVAARTIARQLHPRVLDTHGLSEAVSNLVGKIEDQHDLAIEIHNAVESEDDYSSLVERTA